MLSQTGKVINKRPVRGLPLQTSRRHRQGGEHLRHAGRDDRGEVQAVGPADGPADGAHAEDPQVPHAAAEACWPDPGLARDEECHRIKQAYNFMLDVSEVSL